MVGSNGSRAIVITVLTTVLATGLVAWAGGVRTKADKEDVTAHVEKPCHDEACRKISAIEATVGHVREEQKEQRRENKAAHDLILREIRAVREMR